MKIFENAPSYSAVTAAKAALAAEKVNSGGQSAATKALIKSYFQALLVCATELDHRQMIIQIKQVVDAL